MIKMLTEEILSEVVELLESGIQYRDFEYIKEALIVLKEQDGSDDDEVDHNYNNDYYDEVRSTSDKKKKIKLRQKLGKK